MIPEELRNHRNWVIWHREWKDGRWTKVPYQGKDPDKRASTTDPTTWTDYNTVNMIISNHKTGIGYVFDGTGIYGIDLDGAFNPDGSIYPPFIPIIKELNSYQDISPSGVGLHIILRCSEEPYPSGRKKEWDDGGKREVGVYGKGRYFTFTDTVYNDTTVVDIPVEKVRELLDPFLEPKPEPKPEKKTTLPDDDIISKCRHAKNGLKFHALFDNGDTTGYPSASEADMALAGIIGFYTTDTTQIERIMKHSALTRDKYQREGYMEKTTSKAARGGYIEPIRIELPEPTDPVMVVNLDPDNLIQMHYDRGVLIQDSYPEYHAVTMMALLSYIIPAKMVPQFGEISNNLWIVVLGDSGISGKTSSFKEIISIFNTNDLMGNISRLPDKPTPEAFAELLQENPRRIWIIDEAVGFMKYIRRDYASELPEDMIKAYDHTNFSKKKVKKKDDDGMVQVINPHVSILWNTVPESFSKNVGYEQFETGFYLRPIYLCPKRKKPIKRDAATTLETRTMRANIISRLKRLITAYRNQTIIFEENELLNEWKYQHRENMGTVSTDIKRSALTRSYEHARKIAMVLTIGSKEFVEDLESRPYMDFTQPSQSVLISNELVFKIPDWAAKTAIEWVDKVFMPYFDNVYKLGVCGMGNLQKIQQRLESGELVGRFELGDMVKRHGKQLDDLIAEFDVEMVRASTKGREATYYRLKKLP